LNITPYNKEQLDTMLFIIDYMESLSVSQLDELRNKITDYLAFRKDVSAFFERHLNIICMRKCYESKLSACCTREGIITFFADMVVNVLCSAPVRRNQIIHALKNNHSGNKCVYLGEQGCMWQVKPIVCEMFLCDSVINEAFSGNNGLKEEWEKFRRQEKQFKWPDKPVLFDELETIFIQQGFSSPLMYFHNSPGLMRIKKQSLPKA